MSRGQSRPPASQPSTDPRQDAGPYLLPATLNGSYSWISAKSVATSRTHQYVGWVDADRKVRIARRRHGQGWESSVDLSTVSPTAFSAQATLDSHNTIQVAVDSHGYVHVWGDMHAVALKYMRTSKPGVLTTWVAGAMVGTQESSVTYPIPIMARSGTLYLMYRDGVSGDGDWLLNRWNPVTLAWARVATILQGATDNNSAYPTDVAVNRSTGRWHMLWTIRNQPNAGAQDNTDIYYGYSDDEGVTWRKTDATAYTLPITKTSGEKVVVHGGGTTETILNPHHGGCAVDSNGRPNSLWIIADVGGVDRYRHIWHNGTSWQNDTLLPTTTGGRRPDIVCFADGRRLMVFQTTSGGRGGKLRYFDIDSQVEVVLRDVDMLSHETALQYSLERDVAYVLAPYERLAGLTGGEPADTAAQTGVPVYAIR